MDWIIAYGIGVATGWITGVRWQQGRERRNREREEYNLRMATQADRVWKETA